MVKANLQNYNENEFYDLLESAYSGKISDEKLDSLVYFFSTSIKHPGKRSLIVDPELCGIEDSPEAVITEIKRWYAEQGLKCFKDDECS